MPATRRAIIDVGTNSIKLLVADLLDGKVEPVSEQSEQTRLGAGFYATHRLQPENIAHTARAVASFATEARKLNAASLRVIATSATRDAVNPEDLLSAIQRESGLKVEIISGEQEAEWVLKGVATDPELARGPLLVLDVGGGSTEFILGMDSDKHFARSYPLGTVRLMEQLPHSDPSTAGQLAATRAFVTDFLQREVRPQLQPAFDALSRLDAKLQLVGTGGTATILARMEGRLDNYDRKAIENVRVSRAQITAHAERLWSMPLAARRNMVGLPKSRADIILTGVVIYESVMETFGFSELRISSRGLRFAAVQGS
ncbi:MAG TPA: Ppx/GppA phosphatase family protein [Verrucomicrobiae bacterium]|nr:Ppx/GppA phosphatase family protein [Verrucomicrobiae bacterium]